MRWGVGTGGRARHVMAEAALDQARPVSGTLLIIERQGQDSTIAEHGTYRIVRLLTRGEAATRIEALGRQPDIDP